MPFEGSGGLPTFSSNESVPYSSAAFDVAMVMLSFQSDDSVSFPRAAFGLSALEDLSVAPPVMVATMPLAALSPIRRTGMASCAG